MYQILLIATVGLLVGIMVGLTGVGGGALLVPILVLAMRVPPMIAVGTGALFIAATKVGAAWSYHRQGHVEMRLVGRMALGSVPGAVLGVIALALLRAHLGSGVNGVLKIMIGVLLVATPGIALLKNYLERKGKKSLRDRLPSYITATSGAVMVGFVGGCLVGMTSMGSGSIIMTLLLLFYARPVATLVGTDIAHAAILAAVAGAGHLVLGTVDFRLLAALLLGSIPGAWVAAHLATSVHTAWLRRVLFSVLVVAGLSML
ncbi:MAG TPA: sulfite exporter TauE/SafE family protein [Candidatus Acidoferrales bacterium]|nr:sulfite exporter TauE/SafE family protein [Candidatus Acidoferrales bacterium]